MELFACDLHINQILVDNSTSGGVGAGHGVQGVKGCLRVCQCVPVCALVYVGAPHPPLLAPCLAASLVH